MATINTADELIEVLKSDGRVRSAVRRELLTDELIAMPERLDKLVEAQTTMQEALTTVQQTQTAMLKTQASILENIEGIREEQVALRKEHKADREEDIQAMHRFRGNYAVAAATKNLVGIAMPLARFKNMRQIRCDEVSPDELKDWISNCEDDQVLSEFSDEDLSYFSQVDLAFGVMGRRERSPAFYIAVEAGYTGDSDDLDRAVVRAKILGALTGQDTYAVVASVLLDPSIAGRITEDAESALAAGDNNTAFWHRLVEEDMEPPSPR